jgi:hypothetical protein
LNNAAYTLAHTHITLHYPMITWKKKKKEKKEKEEEEGQSH